MTTQPHHDSKEIDPAEYARRVDEALASLSNEDKMLIDGVRFKILKDVDERLETSRRLHFMDMALIDIGTRCNKIYREQLFPSRRSLDFRERMFLMGAGFVLTASLSVALSFIVFEAGMKDAYGRVARGVLVAKAATAEADQLWCRYDLGRALHGQGTTNSHAPSVMRPDAARIEGRTSPAEANQ